jgi:predicted flap endonuclease-1-like 5' DNA nuclease
MITGAFYEDTDALVHGNLVSFRENAVVPLHPIVYVSQRANEKLGEAAMKERMKELQKLQGIGEVLSRRLVESSYDTIAKVAAAEKKGLERIAGMNPQKIRSVVTQARKMTGEAEKSRHTWLR